MKQIDAPMVHEEYLDDFISILVSVSQGESENPKCDAQALLRMMSPKFQEIVLNSYYSSGELREVMSRPWPRYVGDTEGPYECPMNQVDPNNRPQAHSVICVCEECGFYGKIPVPRRPDDEDADSDFVFCPKCGSPIFINE